jgi:hypothetical protein
MQDKLQLPPEPDSDPTLLLDFVQYTIGLVPKANRVVVLRGLG